MRCHECLVFRDMGVLVTPHLQTCFFKVKFNVSPTKSALYWRQMEFSVGDVATADCSVRLLLFHETSS